MTRNNLVHELLDILAGDMRQLKFVSIWTLLLAGAGFVALGQLSPEAGSQVDYAFALKILPSWAWAVLFCSVAAARAVGLFFWSGTLLISVAVPFVGMSLWVMCFASNVIGSPNANFAVLYLVAASMECWVFGRNLADLQEATHGR